MRTFAYWAEPLFRNHVAESLRAELFKNSLSENQLYHYVSRVSELINNIPTKPP